MGQNLWDTKPDGSEANPYTRYNPSSAPELTKNGHWHKHPQEAEPHRRYNNQGRLIVRRPRGQKPREVDTYDESGDLLDTNTGQPSGRGYYTTLDGKVKPFEKTSREDRYVVAERLPTTQNGEKVEFIKKLYSDGGETDHYGSIHNNTNVDLKAGNTGPQTSQADSASGGTEDTERIERCRAESEAIAQAQAALGERLKAEQVKRNIEQADRDRLQQETDRSTSTARSSNTFGGNESRPSTGGGSSTPTFGRNRVGQISGLQGISTQRFGQQTVDGVVTVKSMLRRRGPDIDVIVTQDVRLGSQAKSQGATWINQDPKDYEG